MHDTAYRIGGLIMDTYLPSVPAHILEIGALNVNGTLRDHSPRNAEYVGLDFEAGEGVDHVITGLSDWNVPDGHFDLVMASSVFEHDSTFWQTFLQMCRKTKTGGHIYLSAPSNGTVHRYPRDCWRFYPDAGLALTDWARSEGFELTLIESFIANRESDNWNDFCAVFRLGPCPDNLNRDFVHTKVPATNALNWRTSLTVNASAETEEMGLLRAAREEGQDLQNAVQVAQAETEAFRLRNEQLVLEGQALRIAVREAGEETGALRAENRALQAECTGLQETMRSVRGELNGVREGERARLQADEARLNALIAQEHEQRDQRITDLNAAHSQRLQERFREIAGLTRLIQERDQTIAGERARVEWLRLVLNVMTKAYSRSLKARLGTMLPAYLSQKRQEKTLQLEGLFDSNEYISTHPDVSSTKIHPLRHYIKHGILEGRATRREA